MASPGDESLPLEYSEPSAKRRAPKKLQAIGLGQVTRPGVAHHFQPGSAAAMFTKQKAEQRMEEWLRGKSTNAPQEKEKGKKKAKKGAKSKRDEETSTATKDAGVEGSNGDFSTGPTVAVAQMGQGKAATKNGKAQDQTQGDASIVAKAPTRQVIKVVTVGRRVKPTQGAWGQRAAENAKYAASKAVATSYSTTPVTIDLADGELSATAVPTSGIPNPEPIIPRAAAAKKPKSVSTQNVSSKTVRKPATKSRASKKSQVPMWSDSDSDEDDQDEDDINDLLLSSRTAAFTTKTPRGRTTKNSSTSKNSKPREKPTRDQPTPQKNNKKKRQVRFEATASPEEGHETTSSNNTTTKTHQDPKATSKKQTNHPSSTPYSTLDFPQANFHIPSPQPKPNQTPSPANLADDEDSQILSAKKQTPTSAQKKKSTAPIPNPRPTFTHNPSSAAAKKKRAQEKQQQQQQQDPPSRRKSVAHPPQPKRARATATNADNNDDDDAYDSAAPVSKKAKTTAETKPPTKTKKKQDLPARKKKGVATKVKAKRARAVVGKESDDNDDE